MLNTKKFYLFLIASAILIIGWPPLPTAFLLFIGFVPILIIHQQLQSSKRKHLKFFGWTYLTLLVFNTGCTWWVWNASISGCIMMLVLNSLIMSLPFLCFSLTRSILPKSGFISLPIFYLAMEYIHFNWSASWPWMTLGKGLASYPWFIQWYEFTGEMGGTLLILIINIWIFKVLQKGTLLKLWQPVFGILVICGISFLSALLTELSITKKMKAVECVVSQPNIDPYEEKFGNGVNVITSEEQLKLALDVSKPLITAQTELLLFPETAIVGWNNEDKINELSLLEPIKNITDSNALNVLTGIESYKFFEVKNKPTITARYDSFSNAWFDCYNSALLVKNNEVDSIYHKSRLVPGVEKMPFEFLEQLSINLGGSSGSLATSKYPINFIINKQLKIAPLICYESVFGDYVNEFVRDGATALAVITNDGWWGNTAGYKQHLLFGAIRCIETRKEMVRSANTGVSAKIDVYGNILHQTKYDERTAFKCSLQPNLKITFYVQYGNLLGQLGVLGAVVLILLSVLFTLFRKSFQSKNK